MYRGRFSLSRAGLGKRIRRPAVLDRNKVLPNFLAIKKSGLVHPAKDYSRATTLLYSKGEGRRGETYRKKMQNPLRRYIQTDLTDQRLRVVLIL